PILRGDLLVAVRIPELDPAGRRAVLLRMARHVGRVFEVAIRDETVERTDRRTHLVDDLIAETRRDRTIEEVLHAVDRHDLVLVFASDQGGVPVPALIADGNISAVILHLPDID